MSKVAIRITHTEGYRGLYAGLSAALLRQLTYSTIRFGVYEDLKVRLHLSGQGDTNSKFLLIPLSAMSGLMGGIAGNPADVVNVRMQSDMSKPPRDQRRYKHALDGIWRIIRSEGFGSLFRGVGANSSRAALMTSSQLASYDMVKGYCLRRLSMDDDTRTHILASMMAGAIATTVCSPVDVVKTRMMNSTGAESIQEFLRQSALVEGHAWVFRGWAPSFLRLGPQTILTMVILEQHKKAYAKIRSLDHDGARI
ncbi:hypothetical protein ACJZ2D_013933 [Fusarium nematophilum]